MANLNDLQNRLTVATERNRQNGANRDALLKEAKEKYGCSSIEELRIKTEEKRAEAAKLVEAAADAARKAEEAVVAVEAAVGGRCGRTLNG